MRTRIAVPLLALAVLVLTFLIRPASSTAAEFSATPQPSVSMVPTSRPMVFWNAAQCATGSLGAARTDQGHVLVPASITICSTWAPKFTFTVVVFYPGWPTAFAMAGNLRQYAPAGPTEVTAVLQVQPDPGRPVGMCLMQSAGHRVACARVETGTGQVTTATPIAVDDPLVAATVVYQDDSEPEGTNPFCGTCLGMPAEPRA
jgi:hypothetical protein